MINNNITYIGVVEDNLDPKRLGRVKVRVMDVFDDIPLEDLPWASPWKDLSGDNFNIPDIGKIVTVVFDQGKENAPEFIYSQHYNVNLENKIKSIGDSDYQSMKSILFDHKTQFYVNDNDGLMIDYMYNNINLNKDNISLNLKDNNSFLNLGDNSANQQAILGNHFMDWMGKFLSELQDGGLFNSSGNAMPTPKLTKLIMEFKALKDIKYLSHHVNIVDNDSVKTVINKERENIAQYGDSWTSTIETNVLTSKKDEDFKPIPGPNSKFNKNV